MLIFVLTLLLSTAVCSHGYVGFNFALMQQLNPMNPFAAAQKFKAAFGKVDHVKLFDYNREYVAALHYVGISNVVVSIPNVDLEAVGHDPKKADEIISMLAPFIAAGMQFTIAIGNEPLAPWYNGDFRSQLLPALYNVHQVLAEKRLLSHVKLTVPFSFSILSSTYPPSTGAFMLEADPLVLEVAELLVNTSSPFFINIYPFSAYRISPIDVPLPYALLETGHTVEGVTYPHLLAAQVAALRFALLRLNNRFTAAALPIVVGETGWPSSGHPAATISRAQTFVNNAIAFSADQSLYLFEAFDEMRKSLDAGAGAQGDGVENHWGVLTENGTQKFPIPVLVDNMSHVPLAPHGRSRSHSGPGKSRKEPAATSSGTNVPPGIEHKSHNGRHPAHSHWVLNVVLLSCLATVAAVALRKLRSRIQYVSLQQ